MGEIHEADFLPGPPAELRWSDGEVWLQSQGSIAAERAIKPTLQTRGERASIVSLALQKDGLDRHTFLQQQGRKEARQTSLDGVDIELLQQRIHYMGKLVRAALSREEELSRDHPMLGLAARSPVSGRSPNASPRLQAAASPAPSTRIAPQTEGLGAYRGAARLGGWGQSLAPTREHLDVWAQALNARPQLRELGDPIAVKIQVVAGQLYEFSFLDGSVVTIFSQPRTQTLQVTDR